MENLKQGFKIKDVCPTNRFEEIVNLLNQEYNADLTSAPVREATEMYLKKLEIGKLKPYAIFKDDVMLGFIILEITTKLNFYINNLYVKPEFRNLGIASTLIKAAEYCAEKLGFSKVQLNSRAGVETFYTKLGYLNVGKNLYEKPIEAAKTL